MISIPLTSLKEVGIRTILCDLDNTLTPAHNPHPVAMSFDFVKNCQENGFDFYIISNNHPKRVKLVADELQVKYHPETKKPFGKRLLKFLNKEGIAKDNCILIGDQILTDVIYANRLGLKSILIEPCSSKDLPITYINRKLDRLIRKRLKKKGLLREIERGESYE